MSEGLSKGEGKTGISRKLHGPACEVICCPALKVIVKHQMSNPSMLSACCHDFVSYTCIEKCRHALITRMFQSVMLRIALSSCVTMAASVCFGACISATEWTTAGITVMSKDAVSQGQAVSRFHFFIPHS